MFVGQNASLSLFNFTLQNCHANYNESLEPESSGRGGAVFVGAWSTLVVKDSVITECSSGRDGGGLYSNTHSHLEMLGVVFQSVAAIICPDPQEACISIDAWTDDWGYGCDVYAANAANPQWCDYMESSVKCCACGGGVPSKPTGFGGTYFAANHVHNARWSFGTALGLSQLGACIWNTMFQQPFPTAPFSTALPLMVLP